MRKSRKIKQFLIKNRKSRKVDEKWEKVGKVGWQESLHTFTFQNN
jgi:hypothetical protein